MTRFAAADTQTLLFLGGYDMKRRLILGTALSALMAAVAVILLHSRLAGQTEGATR